MEAEMEALMAENRAKMDALEGGESGSDSYQSNPPPPRSAQGQRREVRPRGGNREERKREAEREERRRKMERMKAQAAKAQAAHARDKRKVAAQPGGARSKRAQLKAEKMRLAEERAMANAKRKEEFERKRAEKLAAKEREKREHAARLRRIRDKKNADAPIRKFLPSKAERAKMSASGNGPAVQIASGSQVRKSSGGRKGSQPSSQSRQEVQAKAEALKRDRAKKRNDIRAFVREQRRKAAAAKKAAAAAEQAGGEDVGIMWMSPTQHDLAENPEDDEDHNATPPRRERVDVGGGEDEGEDEDEDEEEVLSATAIEAVDDEESKHERIERDNADLVAMMSILQGADVEDVVDASQDPVVVVEDDEDDDDDDDEGDDGDGDDGDGDGGGRGDTHVVSFPMEKDEEEDEGGDDDGRGGVVDGKGRTVGRSSGRKNAEGSALRKTDPGALLGKGGEEEGDDRSSMFNRVESLRMFLEDKLGVELFVSVYCLLRSVSADTDDVNLAQKLGAQLGPSKMRYLTVINQLIHCEDVYFEPIAGGGGGGGSAGAGAGGGGDDDDGSVSASSTSASVASDTSEGRRRRRKKKRKKRGKKKK